MATYVGANKDAEPSGTDDVTPGYNDTVAPSSINDKTLTIYYKPDATWAGTAYVDYAYANGTYNEVARIGMKKVEKTTAEGFAPDAEGWYKADLPEGINTKNVKFRFTNGDGLFDYRDNDNGTSYEANAGTTVIAVSGHQESLGVPFTRTAGGNGTALSSDESQNGGYATSKTTVRLHFAPTEKRHRRGDLGIIPHRYNAGQAICALRFLTEGQFRPNGFGRSGWGLSSCEFPRGRVRIR